MIPVQQNVKDFLSKIRGDKPTEPEEQWGTAQQWRNSRRAEVRWRESRRRKGNKAAFANWRKQQHDAQTAAVKAEAAMLQAAFANWRKQQHDAQTAAVKAETAILQAAFAEAYPGQPCAHPGQPCAHPTGALFLDEAASTA